MPPITIAHALTGERRSDWPSATARYLQVRDAAVKETKVPLDATLIAEFEGYVKQWLDEIGAGQFAPQPHAPNGRCLMCCVDSLGVEELAERAREFGGRAADSASNPSNDGALDRRRAAGVGHR